MKRIQFLEKEIRETNNIMRVRIENSATPSFFIYAKTSDVVSAILTHFNLEVGEITEYPKLTIKKIKKRKGVISE